MINFNCKICGKQVRVANNRLKAKYCSKICMYKDADLAKKISLAQKGKTRPQTTGDKNGKWKEDDVGYYSLHSWIKNHFGEPKKCEHCGITSNLAKIHWANKDHKYTRLRNDWFTLCVKHYAKYDIEVLGKIVGTLNNPNNNSNQRQCITCKKVLPLTKDYFYHDKNRSFGFRYNCVECERKYHTDRWKRLRK